MNEGNDNILEEIKILAENGNYVAVDKPSGLQVHPDGKNKGPFLTDWVVGHFPGAKSVGEALKLPAGGRILKPGIAHRLDADTSGVIVICKNQKAFLHLKSLFKKREVSKEYLAFVYGKLSKPRGSIDRPLGRSAKFFKLWSAQRGAKGRLRQAVTEYEVQKEGEEASFVKVFPKTGRTHQIRAHFKAVHHPVVCDPLYAPKHECLGLSRLALHAAKISFADISGKIFEAESPMPEEFARKLDSLEHAQNPTQN